MAVNELTKDRLGYSLAEFCRAVPMSRREFYRLRDRGEAPAIVRIGCRVVIRRETAEAWMKAREMPASESRQDAA